MAVGWRCGGPVDSDTLITSALQDRVRRCERQGGTGADGHGGLQMTYGLGRAAAASGLRLGRRSPGQDRGSLAALHSAGLRLRGTRPGNVGYSGRAGLKKHTDHPSHRGRSRLHNPLRDRRHPSPSRQTRGTDASRVCRGPSQTKGSELVRVSPRAHPASAVTRARARPGRGAAPEHLHAAYPTWRGTDQY